MKNEKITFDSLLSWKDIFSLGSTGIMYSLIECDRLRACCINDYKRGLFNNDLVKYIQNPLFEYAPGLKSGEKVFSYGFDLYEDENGNFKTKLSLYDFLISFIDAFFINIVVPGIKPDPNKYLLKDRDGHVKEIDLHEYIYHHSDNLKDTIFFLIRDQKAKIRDILECHNEGKFSISNGEIMDNVDSTYFKMINDNLTWLIRNYSKVEEFFNREVPIEVLEHVNKDKLLFSLATDAYENVINFMILSSREEPDLGYLEGKEKNILDSFKYVNNYLLLVRYLKENGNSDYNQFTKYYDHGKEITHSVTELETQFGKVLDDIDSLDTTIKNDFNFCTSYEELLSNKLKDAWTKIENERMVRNIRLNFEMIASGERITIKRSESVGKKYNRTTSTNEQRQAKLKHDYDIVDEKMDYFESKKPVIQALGINEFKGYFANFYENGTVVLDKYFKEVVDRKGKTTVLPAVGEAIYVMNYREFADLSLLKKMEIIREKVENNNQNVQRIYHTQNGSWKKKLDTIIEGYGYGGLDLGLLDMLVTGVNHDNPKQLVK